MIILVSYCNEVIIRMQKILKTSRNLKKKKMLAIKMKKASKNHLIKNLNKSKIQKLNKNIIIHRIRLVNQRKDKKKNQIILKRRIKESFIMKYNLKEKDKTISMNQACLKNKIKTLNINLMMIKRRKKMKSLVKKRQFQTIFKIKISSKKKNFQRMMVCNKLPLLVKFSGIQVIRVYLLNILEKLP